MLLNCIKILSITSCFLCCSLQKKNKQKDSFNETVKNIQKLENWIEYDYQKGIIPKNLASEYYSIVNQVKLQLEAIEEKDRNKKD